MASRKQEQAAPARIDGSVLLLACIVASEAAGLFGAIVTIPAIPTWYASLAKPEFTLLAGFSGPSGRFST